jgi:hypothetical protein
VTNSGSGVAASLDRGNVLSPGNAGFWGFTCIRASAALDGMGKATLSGMVKAGIGVQPAVTTSATVTGT